MFKCNRTHEVLTVSDNPNYVFYNAALDEDLFVFEAYLDVSNAAKSEASTLTVEDIPVNFSHNKALLAAVASKDLRAALESTGNNTRPLEYCEAVCFQVLLNEY